MDATQIQKINEMHASGMNAYQIAKNLNIPPGVAKYHIDRNKLLTITQTPINAPKQNITPAPRNNNENYYKQELDKMYMQEIGKLKHKNKLLVEIISQL
jgi:DNA-directed RNA polymerase specialized sigma subunit